MTAVRATRIALAGDVMLGRGIDQIMPHSADPRLYEGWARTALRYVELAEARSGPIPRNVGPGYVWGDSLDRLARVDVDVRIANLETAVTAGGTPWPGKGIHYRAHPENAACLVAGGIDTVSIANNHTLDWSEQGLVDTLDSLDRVDVGHTGAGREASVAWSPWSTSTFPGRVVMLGVGTRSSGIDPAWSSGSGRFGVALLDSLDRPALERIGHSLDEVRQRGDLSIVSIHWGSNWGYRVPPSHRRFARALIDQAGVDIVHGHSSHHPLGLEVHHERLILYGCGDLINDYEGIAGHEAYRPELGAWYVAELDSSTGVLRGLRLLPTRIQKFSLTTPERRDLRWLAGRLDDQTPTARVKVVDDQLAVEW